MRALVRMIIVVGSLIALSVRAEPENSKPALSIGEKRERVKAYSRCLIADNPVAASDLAIFMNSYSGTSFSIPKSDCIEKTRVQGLLSTVALTGDFLDVYAGTLAKCLRRTNNSALLHVRRKLRVNLPEEKWQDSALSFIGKNKGLGKELNKIGPTCIPNYEKLMTNNTNMQRRVLVHMIRDWQINA